MDVSPSTIWRGAWQEGTYNEASPFETSRLTMVMKPDRALNPSSVRKFACNLKSQSRYMCRNFNGAIDNCCCVLRLSTVAH